MISPREDIADDASEKRRVRSQRNYFDDTETKRGYVKGHIRVARINYRFPRIRLCARFAMVGHRHISRHLIR